MRVEELTALKPEDNKSKQCLHICRTEYLISIAGKRVTSKQINYWLQKQCKEINILPRSTHKIRRSYISKLLSEKVDDAFVQGQAGHTDIATTQKYYHYCINSNKENLEKLNKIISF